jgi:hypothetical protein
LTGSKLQTLQLLVQARTSGSKNSLVVKNCLSVQLAFARLIQLIPRLPVEVVR